MKSNSKSFLKKNKKQIENPIVKTFGIFRGKFKKSTKELLEESDKEGWDE